MVTISTQPSARRAFDEAVAFTRDRVAFGTPSLIPGNAASSRGESKLQLGWAHIDWCLTQIDAGDLTPTEAAAAKLWHTEAQGEIVDATLQLHGGGGYMNEYI